MELNDNDPVYGEIKCQKCNKNKAYWKTKNGYFCGVHSRNVEKIELKKDKKAIAEIKNKQHEERIKKIEEAKNLNSLQKGKVIMTKLLMMKEPEYHDGFIAVFPNRDHGNRKDGIGLPSLSPMNLGPVNHVMKDYPPSINLENYWQFSKVTDPRPENYQKIKTNGFLDKEGHRHGYFGKGAKILYSEFISSKGEVRRYKYLDARFFYCHYYEKLAESNNDLKRLKDLLNQKYNIQIFGYDSFDVRGINMMDHYMDETKAFGHEAVIYSMLTIDDPKNYPWNLYKEKYFDLYVDMV